MKINGITYEVQGCIYECPIDKDIPKIRFSIDIYNSKDRGLGLSFEQMREAKKKVYKMFK